MAALVDKGLIQYDDKVEILALRVFILSFEILQGMLQFHHLVKTLLLLGLHLLA